MKGEKLVLLGTDRAELLDNFQDDRPVIVPEDPVVRRFTEGGVEYVEVRLLKSKDTAIKPAAQYDEMVKRDAMEANRHKGAMG